MKSISHYTNRIWIVTLLGLAFLHNFALACPNCKDNFDLNTTSGSIGAAYGYTIGFMILMPVVIIATLIIKVKRQMDANDKTNLYRETGNGAAHV